MADHLSEEQLAQFEDGELSPRDARHLEWCSECKVRLHDLRSAKAAYVEYRDSVRDRTLLPVPRPWRSISALHEEATRPQKSWLWWQIAAAVAAVCLVVATVSIPRRPISEQASDLIARSAVAEAPSDRVISLRMRGRTLVRPAYLVMASPETDADLAHLQTLFTEAHYSWQKPLSARSLQSWRSGVRDKRDSVSVLKEGTPEQAYRVRTETGSGVLRSVALTLRGNDLRATNGAFQFMGEEPLEIDESAPALPKASPSSPAARQEPPAEIPASPSDTLRVLAALDKIGADVGEPIVISEDAQHQVVVSATGLSPDRRQEVAAVLQQLPHVRLDLDAAPANIPAPAPRARTSERYSTGMPAALRQQWEARLGGGAALQEVTDRVLEESGLAVARARALQFLERTFPPEIEPSLATPDRETLHTLRRRHISELRRLSTEIRAELKPLLPVAAPTPARDLVTTTQKVDESINRLLAGSYAESESAAMLRELSGQLEYLAQLEGGR